MQSLLSLRALLAKMKKLFWLWLALAVLAGLLVLWSSYQNIPERGVATAVVSFSYDGIESGNDPSGNRFDPADLKNADVVRDAAGSAGLDTGEESIQRIQNEITINGNVPSGVLQNVADYTSIYAAGSNASTTSVRNASYFPTQYSVSFDFAAAGYSRENGLALFNALLTTYQTYFYELYGYNASIERSVQALDYSGYDYDRATTVLDARLTLLKNYVERLAAQDNTRFTSKETGYTFSDLVDAVDTMHNEDIVRLSSYIESNNLTKARTDLLDYYTYKIEDEWRYRTQQQEQLETINKLIDGYAKTYAVVTSLTGVEGSDGVQGYEISQSSETYDNLVKEGITCRTNISESDERIAQYRRRAEQLQSGVSTGSSAVVENMLSDTDAKIVKLMEKINQTVSEYYETVRLKRAFQVLSVSDGSSVSAISLIGNALSDGIAAEAFVFGLYLLAAAALSMAPESWSIQRKSLKIKASSAKGSSKATGGKA